MAATQHLRATSTASLNPSQSQISAPVLEFRCMFTHDIRKKAKKWHDGSLRFHTFNKRVMVYDDTKNLVGGLHYRSTDDFAEGLELNLDTHVLVQVEEQLGESSTDLTALLGRQKQDDTGQFARPDPPTRATLSRINAANSRIKPKSIKELLASQPSVDRTRLVIQSPYEQRHALTETRVQDQEPTPKRRKISEGKENNVGIVQKSQVLEKPDKRRSSASIIFPNPVVEVLSDSDSSQLAQRQKPAKEAIRKRDKVRPAQSGPTQIVNQSEPVPSTTKHRPQPLCSPKATGKPRVPAKSAKKSIAEHKSKANKSRGPHSHPTEDAHTAAVSGRTAASAASATQTAPSIAVGSPMRRPTGPRSILKFATQKPRSKLMYRSLLDGTSRASKIAPKESVQAEGRNDTASASHATESQTRRSNFTCHTDIDTLFSATQINQQVSNEDLEPVEESDSPMSSPQSPAVHTFTTHPEIVAHERSEEPSFPDAVPDSPLFLPRTNSQPSPLPSREVVVEENHVSLLSQQILQNGRQSSLDATIPSHQSSPHSSPSSPFLAQARERSLSSSSPIFQHQEFPTTSDRDLNATNMQPQPHEDSDHGDKLRLLPTEYVAQLPPSNLPAKTRLFRRVVSENVLRPLTPTETLPHDESEEDERRQEGDNQDSPLSSDDDDMVNDTPTSKRKSPVQPQRFSDPVDLHLTATPFLASSSPVAQAIDQPPHIGTELPEAAAQRDTLKSIHIPDAAPGPVPGVIEESGPWTSTEAFLLFDWWPPGREKPPYSKYLSTTALGSGSGILTDVAGGTGGGGSAAQYTNKPFVNPSLKKKYGTFGSAKFVSQR